MCVRQPGTHFNGCNNVGQRSLKYTLLELVLPHVSLYARAIYCRRRHCLLTLPTPVAPTMTTLAFLAASNASAWYGLGSMRSPFAACLLPQQRKLTSPPPAGQKMRVAEFPVYWEECSTTLLTKPSNEHAACSRQSSRVAVVCLRWYGGPRSKP